MLKERILEVFEFTKSESPYRKANKGWINKDIFLDLSPSSDTFAEKNEAAKITVFWSPVNTFLSNIFIIIIISSLLVFTSLSFVKGRFNFNLLDIYSIQNIVKTEDNNVLETTQLKDLDSVNFENEKNIEIDELDQTNNISALDGIQINSENDTITTEIDKQENLIKDKKNNIDNKNSENKKSKSNFI